MCVCSLKIRKKYKSSSSNCNVFSVNLVATKKSSLNNRVSNLSPFDMRFSQKTNCASLATELGSDTLYAELPPGFVASILFPVAFLSHSALTQRSFISR
jgi:hypothetical protein